jgi:hypothetical protein
MWLTKNERKLLRIIYIAVKAKIDNDHLESLSTYHYPIESLVVTFQSKHFEKDARHILIKPDEPSRSAYCSKDVNKTISFIHGIGDTECTLNLLKEHNLVEWRKDGDYKISMTYKGFSLGYKYSDWFTRTGLGFAEYKDHWIWLILGFFGGIIGSIIIQWISNLL